jgi:mono/diheme cytochrome c family protein
MSTARRLYAPYCVAALILAALATATSGCMQGPPNSEVIVGKTDRSTTASQDEVGQHSDSSPAMGDPIPSSSRFPSGSPRSTPAPPADPSSDSVTPAAPLAAVGPNPLAELPRGAEQLARVCARGRNDKVVRALCSGPKVDSLLALQAALGLVFTDRTPDSQRDEDDDDEDTDEDDDDENVDEDDDDTGDRNGLANRNPEFALLGHSTSLVGLHVSAINPRAFVFTPLLQRINGYVVVAFTRGSAFVELAAQDSPTSRLTFYLLKFDLACEAAGNCTNADLLTPAIERDWKGVSLYDDQDLKNTVVDCLQCHQPNGPATNSMLRMQELQLPWTHWFSDSLEGGTTLLKDFHDAHGLVEDYAGIPAPLLAETASGFSMSTLVAGQGFGVQPNEFPSLQIELEVKASAQQQPMLNMPRGTSSTWDTLYAASSSGYFIPIPYHDVKVTDPTKLAAASASYRDWLAGKIMPDALIDIRDVLLDEALPDMSFASAKNASGRDVLVQACSQCHNSRLDQTISRANFDATRLDDMSDDVRALARARMSLPATDIKRMPPVMFRTLSDQARQRALEVLDR